MLGTFCVCFCGFSSFRFSLLLFCQFFFRCVVFFFLFFHIVDSTMLGSFYPPFPASTPPFPHPLHPRSPSKLTDYIFLTFFAAPFRRPYLILIFFFNFFGKFQPDLSVTCRCVAPRNVSRGSSCPELLVATKKWSLYPKVFYVFLVVCICCKSKKAFVA